MKKLSFGVAFVCFLLCGFPSVAQQVAKKPANSPRFLNKNYTYGPVDSLPIGFKGVDYLGLVAGFKPAPARDEYESSSDYTKRLVAWAAQVQIGEVTISEPIAVELPQLAGGVVTSKYDADDNRLLYRIDLQSVYDSRDPYVKRQIVYYSNTKVKGKKKTVTGMGVPVTVSMFDTSTVGLFLNRQVANISFGINLKPEDAKRLRADGNIFVVGRVVFPYVYNSETSVTASFDSPLEGLIHKLGLIFDVSEVIFVDGLSGEVMVRMKTLPLCVTSC